MKNRRGFTLIELILTISLIGIVISLIFSLISYTQNNFNNQKVKSDNISNARYAMDYLTREIRKSHEISIKDNIITIDGDIYKIKNRQFFKNDKAIINGIDEIIYNDGIIYNKIDNKIKIVISIGDYKLSSTIYQR